MAALGRPSSCCWRGTSSSWAICNTKRRTRTPSRLGPGTWSWWIRLAKAKEFRQTRIPCEENLLFRRVQAASKMPPLSQFGSRGKHVATLQRYAEWPRCEHVGSHEIRGCSWRPMLQEFNRSYTCETWTYHDLHKNPGVLEALKHLSEPNDSLLSNLMAPLATTFDLWQSGNAEAWQRCQVHSDVRGIQPEPELAISRFGRVSRALRVSRRARAMRVPGGRSGRRLGGQGEGGDAADGAQERLLAGLGRSPLPAGGRDKKEGKSWTSFVLVMLYKVSWYHVF